MRARSVSSGGDFDASDDASRDATISVAPAAARSWTKARPRRPEPPNCNTTFPWREKEGGPDSGIRRTGARGGAGGQRCRVAPKQIESLLDVTGESDDVGADVEES